NNSIVNASVLSGLSLTKTLNVPGQNDNNESSMNQEEAVKVINNLLALLKTGDDNKLLNKENLTTIQGLLNQLEVNISDTGVNVDAKVGSKDIKAYDVLKELVKAVKTETNSLLETKTAKETLQNNIVDKGLVLKEEAPKSKNVETTSNKTVNEVNYVKEILADKSLSDGGKDSNQNPSSAHNKEISKEDKLLSSILKDGDEKANNKFSLIVDRLGTQNTTQISVGPQVINKESIAADVIKNVRFMVTNNIKEMTVKINPGQLGEITIKVVEEAGVMKANIKASSKETYNLLSQQLGDIKKHLGEQSIKIQEVNISIYEEDATFYKDGQFSSNSFQDGSNNRQNNGTEFTGESTEEELKDNNELNEEGNINMLA
ncbi:MAG TPA: flagellar hook-length control protein FliK, partial [Clostridium sp.]